MAATAKIKTQSCTSGSDHSGGGEGVDVACRTRLWPVPVLGSLLKASNAIVSGPPR